MSDREGRAGRLVFPPLERRFSRGGSECVLDRPELDRPEETSKEGGFSENPVVFIPVVFDGFSDRLLPCPGPCACACDCANLAAKLPADDPEP